MTDYTNKIREFLTDFINVNIDELEERYHDKYLELCNLSKVQLDIFIHILNNLLSNCSSDTFVTFYKYAKYNNSQLTDITNYSIDDITKHMSDALSFSFIGFTIKSDFNAIDIDTELNNHLKSLWTDKYNLPSELCLYEHGYLQRYNLIKLNAFAFYCLINPLYNYIFNDSLVVSNKVLLGFPTKEYILKTEEKIHTLDIKNLNERLIKLENLVK